MISPGFLIARIRGIELRVHISLFLLMAYLITVISLQFQSVVDDAGLDPAGLVMAPWGWGVAVALGLFASIALHEFGHALTAQAMGVQVRGITLMMLGGVAQMERMPDARYAELKLALVGPLVSFALGALGYAVHRYVPEPNLQLLGYWLGGANILLGAFNLLPAFPMDGGRALRSALAARHGPLRATQIAVGVSRLLAFALGILGLLSFNLLLVLIAFFIYSAGQSELFSLMAERALRDLRVSELMLHTRFVTENSPIGLAAHEMIDQRATTLPVLRLAGPPQVVSYFDIRRVPKAFWNTTQVKDLMRPAPRVLRAEELVGPLLRELAAGPLQTLPVEESGRLAGLLRYQDLREFLQLRALQEQIVGNEERDRAA